MQLFYTENIENGFINLEAEEARHCAQVLRKQIGDSIQVIDGKGNWYEAVLEECSKKKCLARITSEKEENLRDFKIHIAIAPTKNISRFEWFLEKATELGIDEITPLLCQRSERKVVRLDRLNKILVAAMKQSLKASLPQLNELTKFKDFVKNTETGNNQNFIAHCEESVKVPLTENYKAGKNVCILIGPEGDFSAEEINLALENGFKAVSLGESRLRTETAGLVACHTIHLMNEIVIK